MNRKWTLLGSFGLGAGVMYLLDPVYGNRRQALLVDQANHFNRRAAHFLDVARRDGTNRLQGIYAEIRGWLAFKPASDQVLEERIRSHVGRVASHPRAIHVHVSNGQVDLSGPVLRKEMQPLLRTIWSVRGVKGIENHLDVHHAGTHVSGLQGGRRRESRVEVMQYSWSPAWRLLLGGLGSSAALYGVGRRGVLGTVTGAIGAGVLARAVANRPVMELAGMARRGGPVARTEQRPLAGEGAPKVHNEVEKGWESPAEVEMPAMNPD